jgi:hypothetical protein
MDEIKSYHDEVFVAQCLVSMSKEEPRATPAVGQCDEPTSVSSDEECPMMEDNDDEVRIPIRYSRDNMIATFALPDPHDWERERLSSSSNEW